ncbi:MAG TPA: NAD(P)H-hydrate dehydratase [Clostridia bacterium]|nr:NAD(P)H-hydrate dehydratase [Clostridia bacterium]
MLSLLTPAQMRQLDAHMINEQGIPEEVLMEQAAMGVTAAVEALLPLGGRVFVFCGNGNNGGDGLAVLRQLGTKGIDCCAYLFCAPASLTGLAGLQYRIAIASGLKAEIILDDEALDAIDFTKADVLVDALFGTGLSREISGRYRLVVEKINASKKPVVAVDIPSGINGETGQVLGAAVRASLTVTFMHKKLGHLLFPGREYSGRVSITKIGIPSISLQAAQEWEEADAQALLPPLGLNIHKGDNGRALLCAGSKNYIGAALLSSKAALRAGCGLLHVAVPGGIRAAFYEIPSVICHPAGSGFDWDLESAQIALALIPKMDAAAIGPGMGGGEGIAMLLRAALLSKKPLVLDADALNVLAKNPSLFEHIHEKVVLTPHIGEMSRLINKPADEILNNPLETAANAAKSWGCTLLLKGATSVIAFGDKVCLNASGNPGLAKGGSGDMLTGIILALLAIGADPYKAACAGAFLLGTSAQKAYKLLQERMLLASDVLDVLGEQNR